MQGRRLNSLNDLVVTRDGSVLFADPPFDLPLVFDDPGRLLDIQGEYRLAPGGEMQLLLNILQASTGVVLSPVEHTQFVTGVDSGHPAVRVVDLDQNYHSGPGRVVFEAAPMQWQFPGGPDGIEVEATGSAVYRLPLVAGRASGRDP